MEQIEAEDREGTGSVVPEQNKQEEVPEDWETPEGTPSELPEEVPEETPDEEEAAQPEEVLPQTGTAPSEPGL